MVPSFAPLRSLEAHDNWLSCVAVFKDGTKVITGSDDRRAIVWDVETGKELYMLDGGHEKEMTCVAVFPCGRQVVTGSRDKKAVVWKLQDDREEGVCGTARQFLVLEGHTSEIWSVDIFPNQPWLVTGGIDRRMIIWDSEFGHNLCTFEQHENWITSLGVFPLSPKIITASVDGLCYVLEVYPDRGNQLGYTEMVMLEHREDPKEQGGANGPIVPVYAVAIFPTEERVITGCLDKRAIIWDLDHASKVQKLVGHAGPIYTVAVSRNEKFVATGSFDRKIFVWDPDKGKKLHVLDGHSKLVVHLAIFPSSDRMISASGDKKAIIWTSQLDERRLTIDEDGEENMGSMGSALTLRSSATGQQTSMVSQELGGGQPRQSVLRKSLRTIGTGGTAGTGLRSLAGSEVGRP